MLVFSESSDQIAPSPSAQDIRASTGAAKIVGCQIYYIPQDFTVCETAENALWHVPTQERITPAVWIGYIPTPEHYDALYRAALSKNIILLNSLQEHLNAQEFDRAYDRLSGLTPQSLTITQVSECESAVAALGLPLFVKGTIQSRKAKGWSACVANSLDELRTLTTQLLSLEQRSRGRVIVRQLARLRHTRVSAEGFPFGREYRVFLYQQQVVGFGYYWEGDDPLKTLMPDEERDVLTLAQEAALRVATPYIAVDIGQTDDGSWIVIETGDAQFSGVSQTPLLGLWNTLRGAVEKKHWGV